jgi:hypothetical protein
MGLLRQQSDYSGTTQRQIESAETLLFVFLLFFLCGYGLSFCSTDFRKERLSYSRSRHFAQQQRAGGDLGSINRVPGIIVLSD